MNPYNGYKYKVIDLFAGVGGLSYGFAHDNSFEIIAANEILPKKAKAYSLNHPTVKVYAEDIKYFTAKNVQKDLDRGPSLPEGSTKDHLGKLGSPESLVDIIIGGPPCQAYSTVGKSLINDPRGRLFQEYYRVLKEFNPKLFLCENVKGLLSLQGGELLKNIISLFESLGYKVQFRLLNAADYGVPQVRERVIMIGSKLGSDFKYPEQTHYNPEVVSTELKSRLKPYRTLEEAISDLPFIKSGDESFTYSSEPQNDFQKIMRNKAPAKLMDHNSPKNNPKLVKIMELLPDGGSPKDLPEELRPRSGFQNTYSRL